MILSIPNFIIKQYASMLNKHTIEYSSSYILDGKLFLSVGKILMVYSLNILREYHEIPVNMFKSIAPHINKKGETLINILDHDQIYVRVKDEMLKFKLDTLRFKTSEIFLKYIYESISNNLTMNVEPFDLYYYRLDNIDVKMFNKVIKNKGSLKYCNSDKNYGDVYKIYHVECDNCTYILRQ